MEDPDAESEDEDPADEKDGGAEGDGDGRGVEAALHGSHDLGDAAVGDEAPVGEAGGGVEVVDGDDDDVDGPCEEVRAVVEGAVVLVGAVVVEERRVDGGLDGESDDEVGDGDEGGDGG